MKRRVQTATPVDILLTKTITSADAVTVVKKLTADRGNNVVLRDHYSLPCHTGCFVRRRTGLHHLLKMRW